MLEAVLFLAWTWEVGSIEKHVLYEKWLSCGGATENREGRTCKQEPSEVLDQDWEKETTNECGRGSLTTRKVDLMRVGGSRRGAVREGLAGATRRRRRRRTYRSA